MNNVVTLNESVRRYQSKKDLSPEEYKLHLLAIKSADAVTISELQEQNDNLIKFLENTHYAHDKYHSELIQLKETVSDLELDIEDERIENNQLREKLSSLLEKPEILKASVNTTKLANTTPKLEILNQQLMARLQDAEKKHAAAREKLAVVNQKMLKHLKKSQTQITPSIWQSVAAGLPKESGIYLLTDGIQQCVGYFNCQQAEFAKTTYFSMPTHWMARPNLPE